MIRLLRFEDSDDGSIAVSNADNNKVLGAVHPRGDGEWLALAPAVLGGPYKVNGADMEAVAAGSRQFALSVVVSRLVLVPAIALRAKA